MCSHTGDKYRKCTRIQAPDVLDNRNLFDSAPAGTDLVRHLLHLRIGHGFVGLFNLQFVTYAVTRGNVARTIRALQVSGLRLDAARLRANRLSVVLA